MLQLVSRTHDFVSLTDTVIPPLSRYFKCSTWDSDRDYDPKSTIFVTNCLTNDSWADDLVAQGHAVVIDNLWETPRPREGMLCLTCDKWFWYHEYWYNLKHHLHHYRRTPNIKYQGFMPMRLKRDSRNRVLAWLDQELSNLLWSYPGQCLPGDAHGPDGLPLDRHFNPDWYDSSVFSIVVETSFTDLRITEKTFKPLCFQHPFLIVGAPGVLRILREWGFATFDNVFDENYDQLSDFDSRMRIIKENVRRQIDIANDSETLQRIQHNHQRFYDDSLVLQGFYTDIVCRLLDFIDR